MKKYLYFTRKLLQKNKKNFFISFTIMFVIICIQMLLPFFMRWVISEVEKRQSYAFLISCILIYALFLFISTLIEIARTMSLDVLGGRILQSLREDIYQSFSLADYEDLMSIGKEKLKNILYMDTLDMFRSIVSFSITIIADILLIIILLIISSFINIKLTVVLFIVSVVGFTISMITKKPIANLSMKVNRKMKEDNKIQNEYVDALEEVKTNQLDGYFVEKNKSSLWNFINTSLKADKFQVLLKDLMTNFHQIVSLLIVAVLSMNVKSSSIGNIIYYMYISNILLDTSHSLESSIYYFIQTIPSFENVYNILDMQKNNGQIDVNYINTIEFKNVCFNYNGINKKVMKNKNLLVKKGDVIKVSGTNGSGKSTFVKLIVGLLNPKSGDICFNDISIKELNRERLKEQILYINQDELILNDSIKNYVQAITGQNIADDKLRELKEKVGFDIDIEEVKENGQSLSGGQRKKLLLIKLLIKSQKSSVIIIDEIEAGLDEETKSTVLDIENEIVKEKKDCIIFKISHEKEYDNTSEIPFTKVVEI